MTQDWQLEDDFLDYIGNSEPRNSRKVYIRMSIYLFVIFLIVFFWESVL